MNPREIIESLLELCDSAKSLGDKLKHLSGSTDDVDVVALINSLAMESYDLSIDIQESVDTYKDILEDEMEDLEDIEDDELEIVEPEE